MNKCERHEMDVSPGCDGCILEMLKGLLAVIHGDGGHRTEWVGIKLSVEEAMSKVSRNETVPEFRLLLEASEHLLERKYDFVVTPGDWKQFRAETDRARKFIDVEVDGPKKQDAS